MSFIYLITSPSGTPYIGQSTSTFEFKKAWYRRFEKYNRTDRKIANAIKKYGWNNMKFEIIEEDNAWTKKELNDREIYWIAKYKSVEAGYNMTNGGAGLDSETAKQIVTKMWSRASDEWKAGRAKNCSKGQLKRFKDNPESHITKTRKSIAHRGVYRIESPSGRVWITDIGLKAFAELHKDELKISFWQLFTAYRKCYNNKITSRTGKHINNWKVTRIVDNI